MPLYAVELTFDLDETYRLAVRPAHREYIASLRSSGSVRLAGPMADGDGALLIYNLADRSALDAAIAADPYFSGEQPAATVSSIREWEALSGGTGADERTELIAALARHRGFLRATLNGISDEQAGQRPTVSSLCLGGLIKHVASTEKYWLNFAVNGDGDGDADGSIDWSNLDWANPPQALADMMAAREADFTMAPGDTVASVLAAYEQVAAHTDATLATLDFNATRPLPKAPWFEPGASWSVRRVVTHLIAETSQHAGHADIIRESIDGAKMMG